MARLVVCGYMIRHPLAGNVLAYLHYVLGLHRLGHEVIYLEESGWPESCYNPETGDYTDDPHAGVGGVRRAMAAYGLEIPVCYVNRETGEVYGTNWDELKRMLGAADLLLNIGGVCWLPEFRLCRRRALVDMDPLFTQVGRFGVEGFDEYHAYFSYGVNIGKPGCTVPSAGVEWQPTVPPVVPEMWEGRGRTGVPAGEVFTTIANWHAYGSVTYNGEQHGQKDGEFLRLLDLPGRTAQRLELAIAGVDPETSGRLRAAGWSLRNAGEVSTGLNEYIDYITGSRGEFSAAKQAYVQTHSGWFSDRSVCYLAAGLPVVLQDTGFTEWLETGCGVLAFETLEEAADCLERVNAEYDAHRRAARGIAEGSFSYRVVLPELLDRVMKDGAGERGQG